MTDNSNSSNSNDAATPVSLPNDLNNINNLTNYVNTIFHQMEEKFLAASDQMMTRMNELGKKIDSLETNIGEIIATLPNEGAGSNESSNKPQT